MPTPGSPLCRDAGLGSNVSSSEMPALAAPATAGRLPHSSLCVS